VFSSLEGPSASFLIPDAPKLRLGQPEDKPGSRFSTTVPSRNKCMRPDALTTSVSNSGSPKENGLLRELNGILADECLKPEILTLDRTLTSKPSVQRGPARARTFALDSGGP
jgi:hypothetical protein